VRAWSSCAALLNAEMSRHILLPYRVLGLGAEGARVRSDIGTGTDTRVRLICLTRTRTVRVVYMVRVKHTVRVVRIKQRVHMVRVKHRVHLVHTQYRQSRSALHIDHYNPTHTPQSHHLDTPSKPRLRSFC
jgi:hypothetical protein